MLTLTTKAGILKTNSASPQKDNRNLFITTAEDSAEKSYDQTQRMKTVYRQEYLNAMNQFNFRNQLEKVNENNLQEIHMVYSKLINNIKKAKFFLGDKMENIYNNFIMPGKWFY